MKYPNKKVNLRKKIPIFIVVFMATWLTIAYIFISNYLVEEKEENEIMRICVSIVILAITYVLTLNIFTLISYPFRKIRRKIIKNQKINKE